MPDRTTIRAMRLGPDEQLADSALAAMVGTAATPSGTVVAARVKDGWLELDIEGLEVGSSVVTSLSTGEQHVRPAAVPIEPTRWFPE